MLTRSKATTSEPAAAELELIQIPELIQFLVGGYPFTLSADDINRYPESFFARAIDKQWRANDSPIEIKRDGGLFRIISSFLVSGQLPRVNGKLKFSAETIAAIKVEADFYNLPALVKDCECRFSQTADEALAGYHTMRSYVDRAKGGVNYYCKDQCAYPTKNSHLSPLVDALTAVWAPFCTSGSIKLDHYLKSQDALFKTSTLGALKIRELLEAAQESAFGRGTETLIDPTVRKSWEIPAAQLVTKTVEKLKYYLQGGAQMLAPHYNVELRPYKLVIYQDGGHFDAHRDSVRGDGHIGTLVLILNSEYTGGELEITHNGQTEVVTGPYSWVAMYGDCLHKINPVTSGTRVSLIFDIYKGKVVSNQRSRDDYYDEDKITDFWNDNYYMAPPSVADPIRGVTDANRQIILDGVNQELEASESVVICLAHKYPLCQAVPEFLKGGDRALYDLLKDRYDAQVVACTVVHLKYASEEEVGEEAVSAELFTVFDPDAAAAAKAAAKEAAQAVRGTAKMTKRAQMVIIPNTMGYESVLDYSPYIDNTGNQCQPASKVYLVAGLQLRRRDV